ncbi:gamma-glutamyl hydrolase [Penaeus vannamei]|uniref:folate gamma-glutamyl hydrolase n=1 Tax=Penaeus vannamei TaxID=6689 RepID=A0A423U726_PENVA|nr:gamma-glutamyl hydrolase [Penaeus vannamei]
MAGKASTAVALLAGALCCVQAQFDFTLRPIIGLEDKNTSYIVHLREISRALEPEWSDSVLCSQVAPALSPAPVDTEQLVPKIYQLVREANLRGVYLPLWGTCLGFEMLTYLAAGEKKWLASCNASNKADRLNVSADYMDSRIFTQMPDNVIGFVRLMDTTANYHKWCMTPENFTLSGLADEFKLLATSYDFDDLEYVALMEHVALPIFGSQFHPEKNQFEWKDDSKHDAIPHSPQAVGVAQYFANFFANQAHTAFPHAHTAFPHAYTAFPHAHTDLPHAHTELPHAHTAFPHAHTELPHAHTAFLHAHTAFPHVHIELPHAHTDLLHAHTAFLHAHTHSFTPTPFLHAHTAFPHAHIELPHAHTDLHAHTAFLHAHTPLPSTPSRPHSLLTPTLHSLTPTHSTPSRPHSTSLTPTHSLPHAHAPLPHTLHTLTPTLTSLPLSPARQNNQKFPTEEEETAALIYNYEPFFTQETSGFVQVYLFR